MGRWNGVCGDKGRWKQNLIAKCLREGKAHDDASVSPVVRQTLLHWAYEITAGDFVSGAKRVKTHGAAYVSTDSLQGVLSGAKRKKAISGDDADDTDGAAAHEVAGKAAEERERRAQKRAEGAVKTEDEDGGARPAKRARAAAAKPAAKSNKAAKAGPPGERSDYERKRDAQRAQNESKLRDLGLA